MTGKLSVVMIGAGNVASHLAKALYSQGYAILQVFSRTEKAAKTLAIQVNAAYTASFSALFTGADLYIYSLKDDALATFAGKQPAESGNPLFHPDAIHIHTTGSVSIDVFYGSKIKYGVLYPLQTISMDKELDFKSVPLYLEASSPEVMKVLQVLAGDLSDNVLEASSEQRLALHVAAVFSCNFVNYFYGLGKDLLDEYGLDFKNLFPLIKETASKIEFLDPDEGQTGPARRNDIETMEKHLKLLQNNSELSQIYTQISEKIIRKYYS